MDIGSCQSAIACIHVPCMACLQVVLCNGMYGQVLVHEQTAIHLDQGCHSSLSFVLLGSFFHHPMIKAYMLTGCKQCANLLVGAYAEMTTYG